MKTDRESVASPPPCPEIADREIFTRIARGEVSALAVLYERYRGPLFRFVSHATKHASDAEDIVQSTFLVAARTARSYDGRANARPWIFGIASRLVHRRLRTRARWLRTFGELARRFRGAYHDAPRHLSLRNELTRALEGLSEAKRVTILLAEVEGMSCEEIASALRVPVGTVWTRLHHARLELRDAIQRGRS